MLKRFNLCGAATRLITELDPDYEDLAYGLAGLGSPETGHVSVHQLSSIRLTRGALGIERDLHWRADKSLSAYL